MMGGNNTWTPGPGSYKSDHYNITKSVMTTKLKVMGLQKPAFISSQPRHLGDD